MNRIINLLLILCCFSISSANAASDEKRLKVGITLHPYYSWVANVGGERVDITPVLPEFADAHTYQLRPTDIMNLQHLDLLVINGEGHDDFIAPMLNAAGNQGLVTFSPALQVPPISTDTRRTNSHHFLSASGASQQIYAIAEQLALADPDYASLYLKNARFYVKSLRQQLAKSISLLKQGTPIPFATMDDTHAYLFTELGLSNGIVIHSNHGAPLNAKLLLQTIEKLNRENIPILFTSSLFPDDLLQLIENTTEVNVYTLDHMASGSYHADSFERQLADNYATVVQALNSGTTDEW